VLAVPGLPAPSELQRIGIARVSQGPGSLRVAMNALRAFADDLLAGAG
jgi:2-methylisocitrate lyase-like PEP mutase family enzyme